MAAEDEMRPLACGLGNISCLTLLLPHLPRVPTLQPARPWALWPPLV